jgi:hypothetical protein
LNAPAGASQTAPSGRKNISAVKASGDLAAESLTAEYVTLGLASHKAWGTTTKRNAITAVQRAFNWAVRDDGLP